MKSKTGMVVSIAVAALGFSALPGKGSLVVEDDGLYVAKGLAIIVR